MNCNQGTYGAGALAVDPPCRSSCGQGYVLHSCNQSKTYGGGGGNYFGSPTQAAMYIKDLVSALGPLQHNVSITLQVGLQAHGMLGQAGTVYLAAGVTPVQRMENEATTN